MTMPRTLNDNLADEETALLTTTSEGGSSFHEPTPLPKLQIGILMLFQLAEPMTSHCIYVRSWFCTALL
jgi:hypothetical protein